MLKPLDRTHGSAASRFSNQSSKMTNTGARSQDQLCWGMSKAGRVEPMLCSNSGRGFQDSLPQWALFASALYPEACDLVLASHPCTLAPRHFPNGCGYSRGNFGPLCWKILRVSLTQPSLSEADSSLPSWWRGLLSDPQLTKTPSTYCALGARKWNFSFPSTQRLSLERRSVSDCELCLLIYIVSSQIKETMTYNCYILVIN